MDWNTSEINVHEFIMLKKKKKKPLIGPYQKWLRHQLIALEINFQKGKN